jgi:hypothetical protein
MGYEYTIQGWYRSKFAVDLKGISSTGAGGYEFVEHDSLDLSLRVMGRNQNYVLFATEAKNRVNSYLAALSAVMEASDDSGNGLITVTGEWCYDGKDQFVIAAGGGLFNLPTARIYDPLSPWNSVYRWSHYMGRDIGELSVMDSARLGRTLAGRSSIKGWLRLHDFQTADADANGIIVELVGRDRRLEGGISFLNQFSEPFLLLGRDALVSTRFARPPGYQATAYNPAHGSFARSRPIGDAARQGGRSAQLLWLAARLQGD